jgi:hypothetical protein
MSAPSTAIAPPVLAANKVTTPPSIGTIPIGRKGAAFQYTLLALTARFPPPTEASVVGVPPAIGAFITVPGPPSPVVTQ